MINNENGDAALKKEKKKRVKIHEITAENDMKYRGPLNLTHFKIFGWICVVIGQAGFLMSAFKAFLKIGDEAYENTANVFSFIGSFALLFLLIANFALILNSREKYFQVIFKYAGLTLGVAALFYYVYDHILIGVFAKYAPEIPLAEFIITASPKYEESGFFVFNLFIDLFLCTLFMFFLDYRPKKIFTGKALIIFRLFAILPVSYEAASIVIKLLASNKTIVLDPHLFPFLPAKPPVAFFVFLALVLFEKLREKKFIKQGKTHEEYREFLKTNTNSFHFGVQAAIVFVIAGLLDVVLQFAVGVAFAKNNFTAETLMSAYLLAGRMGFGETMPLIFIAPLMLLFSYNRVYKSQLILNIAIPAVGAGATVFTYIEMIYQTFIEQFDTLPRL